MNFQKKISFLILSLLLLPTISIQAASIIDTVSGRILLSVEEHGEAWYVDPVAEERFYLKDGEAAFTALRTYGLGITDVDLNKIPVGTDDRFTSTDTDGDGLFDTLETGLGTNYLLSDTDGDGFSDKDEVLDGYNPVGDGLITYDNSLIQRLSGRILLQVERNGEAWYINPADDKRYYMPDGTSAYDLMRYLGLGITVTNLEQIPIADVGLLTMQGSSAESTFVEETLSTTSGDFWVSAVILKKDTFTLITQVADDTECENDCSAQPLETYIADNQAFAGINGTYFCPPDYAYCAEKTYSFLPPVYDVDTDKIIRENTMSFHNRPMIAALEDGRLMYFHRDEDFGVSLAAFENEVGSEVTGVIGSWPSLIEAGQNVLANEPQEATFTNKGRRDGIGWDDEYIYLISVGSASMSDLAVIFQTINVDYAMNLDGGGSSAFYYNGDYKVGPGRLLPNAVVFTRK